MKCRTTLVQRGRVRLDVLNKAQLRRLREITELVKKCDDEIQKESADPLHQRLYPIFTSGVSLHCYRQEVATTRRHRSQYKPLATFKPKGFRPLPWHSVELLRWSG